MVYAVITVKGVVQGVGFRPFINRLANKYNLKGRVYNRTGSVIIEINGFKKNINEFLISIKKEKPEIAFISNISIVYPSQKKFFKNFSIKKSKYFDEPKIIPPDIKICNLCKDELFNRQDRRFHYAFINCTNCGPRFSIILNTPYDRNNTTMKKFKMCSMCLKEYKDINNRRYHAEPNACSVCGPNVFLKDRTSKILKGDSAIKKAKQLLKKGEIVAVKGIGGFHLACDATNNKAVLKLKMRKKRSDKPLAIMVDTFEKINKIAYVSPFEKDILKSAAAPIVLLKSRKNKIISPEIAKGLNRIGIFLPYTPLHCLLFDKDIFALVMTSGNISEEPIQYKNKECFKTLKGITDYFLYHDRDINIPVDDSVIKPYKVNNKGDNFIFIRRSRGYVPLKIETDTNGKNAIGMGALLKNTICLMEKSGAIISQHIGDLENERVFKYYKQTIDDFIRFYEFKPEVLACDLHPDFLSSIYANELSEKYKIKTVKIQHHYAHLLSVLAENKIYEQKAIGVIFDGTGLGKDNTIWGGEFLIGDFKTFERCGHFKCFKLPGGDLAAKETIRPAVSLLYNFMDKKDIKKIFKNKEIDLIIEMLEKNINSPATTSAGRIFDAISAILGICYKSTYEAQAPMLLESLAEQFKGEGKVYKYLITQINNKYEINIEEALKEIIDDLKKHDKKYIAYSFHKTMAYLIFDMVKILNKATSIKNVALSGGVFQNAVLLSIVIKLLKKKGFNVLLHRNLSPNDSSIAFGQAVYASVNS